MSIATDIRDRVIADFISAGTAYFGVTHPFTPDAKWFAQSDQTTTGLGVHVLCDGLQRTRLTRNSQQLDVALIVHVEKKLDDDAAATVDSLATVLELIDQYYYETARTTTIKATLSSSSIQFPTRAMLKNSRRFYGWVRLNFQAVNTF